MRKQAIIEKLISPISPLNLPCISPASPQAIIEKLISHRFFRRKQGLPRMAKHMEQQRHRARRPEAEPKT